VNKAFKKLTKSAQATGEDDDIGEDDLDEMVRTITTPIVMHQFSVTARKGEGGTR
jgi:hypothetical protein